jgi:Cytochrome c, mono- and diheme variants
MMTTRTTRGPARQTTTTTRSGSSSSPSSSWSYRCLFGLMLSSILFLQLISSTTCFTLVPAAAYHPSSLYVRSLRKNTPPVPPHHRDHHRHRTTPPTTILFLQEQQHQERELFRTFSIATPPAAAAPIEGKVTNTVAYASSRHHQFISSRLFILAAAAVVGTTSASVFCHPMPANAAAALSSPDGSIVEKGQAIFDSTCAACHKGGGNVVAKERTLTQEALTKFLGPLENGSEDISTFVQNSSVHRGALVFSGKLTEEDYTNVAAYIYDQAMENKW